MSLETIERIVLCIARNVNLRISNVRLLTGVSLICNVICIFHHACLMCDLFADKV